MHDDQIPGRHAAILGAVEGPERAQRDVDRRDLLKLGTSATAAGAALAIAPAAAVAASASRPPGHPAPDARAQRLTAFDIRPLALVDPPSHAPAAPTHLGALASGAVEEPARLFIEAVQLALPDLDLTAPTGVVFGAGGFGADSASELGHLAGFASATPLPSDAIRTWLYGLDGLRAWQSASAALDLMPLPIAVLSGADAVLRLPGAHQTLAATGPLRHLATSRGPMTMPALGDPGAASTTPNQPPEEAPNEPQSHIAGLSRADIAFLTGRPPLQVAALDAYVTGPIIAAHVPLGLWERLSSTHQATLVACAAMSVLRYEAARSAFARDVLPVLDAHTQRAMDRGFAAPTPIAISNSGLRLDADDMRTRALLGPLMQPGTRRGGRGSKEFPAAV
ncbi:MAG: hypothetical protein AAFR55_01300 [Pseudomonadota bacterium]